MARCGSRQVSTGSRLSDPDSMPVRSGSWSSKANTPLSCSSCTNWPRRPHRLGEVLEVLTWFESDGPTRGNTYFPAGARVSSDTLLSGFDLKHTEPSQLDRLTPHHRLLHGIQHT